jgi:Flp pilus assembly pilin Flp
LERSEQFQLDVTLARSFAGILAMRLPSLRNQSYACLRAERGATAIEYALMVGLLAIGIISAVTALKDVTSDRLAYAAGDVYTWNIGNRVLNLTMLVNGTTINGSFNDPVFPNVRDSTFTGTLVGNTLDAYRTAVLSGYNGCTQHYTATTSDNRATFTGTWTGDYAGGCNPGQGTSTFIFQRVRG